MATVVMVEKRSSKMTLEDGTRPGSSAHPLPVQLDRSTPAKALAEPAEPTAKELLARPDPLSASERYRRISLCAYFKAQQRGFEPGHMWEDWLAAEHEVDRNPGL